MASKQYLFALSTADDQLSTKRTICRICGDKASIVNYGVLSCSSCKTFFRRHGFNIQVNIHSKLYSIIFQFVFDRITDCVYSVEIVR
jgi:hypothetical protein